MTIRWMVFVSIFAVTVLIGCADNPVGETEGELSSVTFTANSDQQVALAPQQDAEDKPSARLLAFFPEHFPDGVEHSIPLNEIFHGGPAKDGIPALTNPKTLPADAADYLRDDDLVLGLAINGESRAYPLRIMNWHEIVNDTLGGRPILVTFCPLCGTGIAFDPIIDGQSTEFGVSGMLHNNDLLMYDRGTDAPSLWQQVLGAAVVGPQTNTLLDLIPVIQAQWGEWKADHPTTSVLSTDTGFNRNYDLNPYAGYEKNPGLLFPLAGEEDTRLSRKTKVLGVRMGVVSKAYVLDALREKQVLNDDVAGVPIVLIASATSDSVRVYERKNFQFEGALDKLVETGTGNVWTISEEALSDPKTGDSLERVSNVFVSFWFAWFSFYPDTLFFQGTVNVHPEARLYTTWGELKQ
ncbi:DUF3179 domain-containing protein [Candidatus Poribacteria bacterium]|nr:DUF3179 domain-containing protein [Candidatus Poribacteria bacterium]